jgi:hypothetical protein
MPPRAVSFVLGALALSLGSQSAGAQQPERFTLPTDHSAIYDLVGEIEVRPGTGKAIEVEVVRGGRDAKELTIEQAPVGNYDALRVVFPSDEIVYPRMSRGSNSNFEVREDGTFGSHWFGERHEHRHNGGRGYGRERDRDRDWGRQVRIRGSGTGLEAYADLKVTVPEGASLALHIGVGKAMVTNVNGRISVDAASAPVTAQGIKGALDVDVGSGSVTVTDADGDVSIDAGSGDVRVTSVKGRDFSIDTGSGEVNATDLTVEKGSVEAGSGDLTLSGIHSSDFHLETGSGRIDAQFATDIASLSVSTGSGDVILRVPDNLGAMLDVETGSGGIHADFPLEVQRWARDHVTGRIGDGNGHLDVETGSGDVRIVKLGAASTPPKR